MKSNNIKDVTFTIEIQCKYNFSGLEFFSVLLEVLISWEQQIMGYSLQEFSSGLKDIILKAGLKRPNLKSWA